MVSTIAGIIFVIFGVFAFAVGLLNWQTILEPSRNYTFINLLGPKGKRIFYCVLGVFLWAVGLAFITGAIRFGTDR
ncbi:MAG: immunity 17 family protein [Chloroflexi bacterium]|nr:immunity 17 family protein [Chloroflexota bacterium]